MAISIKHYVVGFQISKNDIPSMKILNSQNNLCEVHACSILLKYAVFFYLTRHVAARSIVEQQKEFFWSLESILESRGKRMIYRR